VLCSAAVSSPTRLFIATQQTSIIEEYDEFAERNWGKFTLN